MEIQNTPHPLHIFVCTNTRQDGKTSCGDSGEALQVFDQLKGRCKEAGLKLRVSRTGCLGPCAQGPNIMCYPKGVWFQNVHLSDLPELELKIHELAAGQ